MLDLDWYDTASGNDEYRRTSISIRAKNWGYENTDLYTGNYEIAVSRNGTRPAIDFTDLFKQQDEIVLQIVTIAEFGQALKFLRDHPNTDFNPTDKEIERIWCEWIKTHNDNHDKLFIRKFNARTKRYYVDETGGFRDYFFFCNNHIIRQTEKAILFDHPVVGEQWVAKSQCFWYTEDNEKYVADRAERYGHTDYVRETYVRRWTCNQFKNL